MPVVEELGVGLLHPPLEGRIQLPHHAQVLGLARFPSSVLKATVFMGHHHKRKPVGLVHAEVSSERHEDQKENLEATKSTDRQEGRLEIEECFLRLSKQCFCVLCLL